MGKSILILAYYSYKDPIFQSAVLPYFVDFPKKENYQFVLLTFEKREFQMTPKEIEQIDRWLGEEHIIWYRAKWNSGKFKIFKKIFDLLRGITLSAQLTFKYRVSAVYSEGFPGAILGYYICKLLNRKHMVHTFEPHADYMIESGVWTKQSWEASLIGYHERKIARHATYIFTATSGMIARLKEWGVSGEAIFRVPSCVDLSHFFFNAESRSKIRHELSINKDELVVTYLGKFGGMYMEQEVFKFFKTCLSIIKCRFFILSNDDRDKIMNWVNMYSLQDHVIIKSLNRNEVPAYLSASDFGFVAVRQWPSKKFCSPIKTGEYMACGLPVIVPRGISDDDELLQREGLGILMESTQAESYIEVAKQIKDWNHSGSVDAIRKKAHCYVKEDRSVTTYKSLYETLFSKL